VVLEQPSAIGRILDWCSISQTIGGIAVEYHRILSSDPKYVDDSPSMPIKTINSFLSVFEVHAVVMNQIL
jgi:hypothetical protein